ncbi:porin family protein [Stenotrophomonas sp. Marseille-Q4652]|uniref:porin family protein n=1 Tax=Stenotrophomonas sp. Marseille-Q4652 TaxID=2866595 RepID=UPI001CE40DF4|nr:porin family protein [Stenotrophomonas sp. Marseille-Q4652]
MNKTLILAGTLALAAFSSQAMAGQAFVRAEAGFSDIDVSYGGYRESEDDSSGVIGGGYWFNPNFAVEGHVGSLYNKYLGYDEELDLVTVGVGVVGKKHFGNGSTGLFVGGRAGIARLTAQVREDTFDVVEDETSVKPYYGVFGGYDFNRNWGLSLNYDRRKANFDGIDVKVDTFSVGGEYRF